jgi:hypothetical protein
MKNLFLSLLILITSFSVKSQNSDFPYSQKDYLITMNEVVEVVESLYNTYGEDTSVVNKLMDLSSSKVYVLSGLGAIDDRFDKSAAIEGWLVPTINSSCDYLPTTLTVIEKECDKWGVWFRVKVTNMYGVNNYIDLAINKENKLRSIIL